MIRLYFLLTLVFSAFYAVAQDSDMDFNVFTGGLFMKQGNWEAKFYNNLYTQIEPQYSAPDKRSSFNTSFLQITIGSDRNINYGFDFLYKSNVINDFGSVSPFHVFQFMQATKIREYMGENVETHFNHGFTHFGPRLRTKPFKNKKFTFQQSIYAPTGALDEGWIINTDLFFEHIHNGKYMIFGDLGIWYPLNADPFVYARVFAGTLLAQRFGPFVMINLPYELGAGMKIFITRKLELEFMYTYWLPWDFIVGDRKPQTLNFGIRLTNFNNF